MNTPVHSRGTYLRVVTVLFAASFGIAGCLGGDSDDPSAVTPPGGGSNGSANTAPTISGSPSAQISAGQTYTFDLSANDVDGDSLTFSASNLPSWASVNSSSGQVTAAPEAGDVGFYSGITFSVSDGSATSSVGPFSIEVVAAGGANGSATLSWNAPTQNEDGSPLTDLAGFVLYWGTSPGNYSNSQLIDNPGLTTYVVTGLSPGTYEFAVTAMNSSGIESGFSNTAVKSISP